MVIWITGRAGAGKTAVAEKLKGVIPNAIVIDGDKIRALFPTGFSDEERYRHIMRLGELAAWLEEHGLFPIVACVSPKKEWRQRARLLCEASSLIYLPGGTLWEGTTYEVPDDEELA